MKSFQITSGTLIGSLSLGAFALAPALAAEQTIVLASTTSVDNSG